MRPPVSLEVAPAVKSVFNDFGHDPKSRFTAIGLEYWFNPALEQPSFKTGKRVAADQFTAKRS